MHVSDSRVRSSSHSVLSVTKTDVPLLQIKRRGTHHQRFPHYFFLLRDQLTGRSVMAAYGQTQYSPALQSAGPYTPYTHHTQGYSMPSYSEYKQTRVIFGCLSSCIILTIISKAKKKFVMCWQGIQVQLNFRLFTLESTSLCSSVYFS